MARKPTYEELEQRVMELEKESVVRKQVEKVLRKERDRAQQYLDIAGVIILAINTKGEVSLINKKGCEVLGYKQKDIIGKVWFDNFLPERIRDEVKEVSQKLLAGEIELAEYFENPVLTKSGQERTIAWHNTTLKDEAGNIVGHLSSGDHVTEQKHAEEALKESEQKYRSLVNEIRDGFFITDNKGTLTFINKALAKMHGYKNPEEILGRTFIGFIPPEVRDEIMEKFSRATKDRNFSELIELPIIRKDRSIIFVQLKASPVMEEGRIVGTRGVIRDITDHKQAEEALRVKDSAIASSINAIALADLEGNLTYVNPSFLKMWGYEDHKEILGKPTIEFSQLEDNALEVIEALRDKGGWSGEQVAKRKDGSVFNIQLSASMVTDEVGKPICMMSSFIDITERKHAEEEKEKLQAQLQRAQKMEAIGTLAGGVAHDLNNILAGLVSYPDLLLMEIPEESPLRNPILTIQKSGEKAAAIVQDLLTLARRGVAVTEVVNLNLIISEYIKSPEHERLISFHPNVYARTDLEEDLLNILTSPAHLSKTIMNLVSNAAEAMPDGGEISISTQNRYIDQPIRGYDDVKEGDYVTLTVSDTGVGISRKDNERIFEPFYTKKVMGRSGTGLGMAVVWGTVKDSKGYIDIQSAKGKGATFTLYFPITRKELPKDKSLVSIEDYMGKGESILVVDDVEEQREIATKILKKLGYSVSTVSGGEEAVDYLKDNSVDLLILDMIMDPGIDGLETYKRIIEFHPKQKALIVSGFSETKRVKKAQRLGAGAYVKKPFLLEKIGVAVRDELDKELPF